MKFSREQMDAYVEGFRSREALKEEQRKEVEARAMETVERWVERLRGIPEVRRIILYGSLVKGSYRPGSDIDLAVEGLPAEHHFRVWSELEREEGGELDLQRWEEFSEGFRGVILSYGRVLYERA